MNMDYKNILAAVDGSTEAEWAFKKAVNIAKRNNARLILCHIIDLKPLAPYEVYDIAVIQAAEKFANELLTDYHQLALEFKVNDVTSIVEHGSPKSKIPTEITLKYDVDLIICGATGFNEIQRLSIGSVAEYILRHAKCDVLVVRIPKEEEKELQSLQLHLAE